jgi:hypothetical protein
LRDTCRQGLAFELWDVGVVFSVKRVVGERGHVLWSWRVVDQQINRLFIHGIRVVCYGFTLRYCIGGEITTMVRNWNKIQEENMSFCRHLRWLIYYSICLRSAWVHYLVSRYTSKFVIASISSSILNNSRMVPLRSRSLARRPRRRSLPPLQTTSCLVCL